MNATRRGQAIESVEELLAHAVAMEQEASQRYEELADQMEVHHNHEVAALFRKLAEIEQMHVVKMEGLSAHLELPHIPPWEYRWGGPEAPEALDGARMHYLIQPHQAVALALEHERRGAAFYAKLARNAKDEAVRKMARQLAEEEEEHVRWLEQWLSRYPKPEEGWDQDPDPPNAHE